MRHYRIITVTNVSCKAITITVLANFYSETKEGKRISDLFSGNEVARVWRYK